MWFYVYVYLGSNRRMTDHKGKLLKSISDQLFGAKDAELFAKWPTLKQKLLIFDIFAVPLASCENLW